MHASDVIHAALTDTKGNLNWYVSDLSDADLLVRPVPMANHIAWQLGHLIVAEKQLGGMVPGFVYAELPAGYKELYSKEGAGKDQGFEKKAVYVDLFNKMRDTTLAAVSKLNDADLDKPTQGPIAPFAPKLGDLFNLQAHHALMHAGQFTVVRRKLDKPVLF